MIITVKICNSAGIYIVLLFLPFSNLLRLVLTEEVIDDGLKENSKHRKEKPKKDIGARIVPLIVRTKVRPRVKTCYPNFFLHKIIIEPSYMINELTKDISSFFQLHILLLDLSFKIWNQGQALRKNGI